MKGEWTDPMTEAPKDLILEGLKLVYRDDGLNQVAQAANAMSAAVPRLSEADLRQIAEQVAAVIVDQNLRSASEQERSKWRSRLADISYQLAIGVAGGGLYALLAYIANLASASFASHGGSDSADDAGRQAARARLLQAVPKDDRKSVEDLLSFPMLPNVVGVQLEQQLAQDQGFRDFSAYVADQEKGGMTVPRSWWSRMADVVSSKPETRSAERSGQEETRQRLLVQSIARGVFFGVTRKTSERLEVS